MSQISVRKSTNTESTLYNWWVLNSGFFCTNLNYLQKLLVNDFSYTGVPPVGKQSKMKCNYMLWKNP